MIPPKRRPSPSLRNSLLAILSGVLLTLSFSPNGYFSVAAWFAMIPLLMGVQQASPSNAFRLGLISGLSHYLTLIYWIVVVLEHYGNLHLLVAVFSLVLLSLYLSLYTAVFSLLASRLADSWRYPFMLACYWVALEYLKAHLLTGFPWCLIGYSPYEHLPVIQMADLFGVYGISFLIVLVNGLLFGMRRHRPLGVGNSLKWEIPVIVLLLAGAWTYGHYRLTTIRSEGQGGRSVDVAVVQANIDQSVKWDPAYQEKTIDTYHRLTRSAASSHPELVVWPETALPFFFQEHSKLSLGVRSLADQSNAALVFGSPAYERDGRTVRYHNRAYLVGPDGRDILYYDKNHLVPFGEYVPLKKYLPFIRRLVEAAGDFAPGKGLTPLQKGNLSLGVLICFEAIFPELARAFVEDGANILVNLTNDAWFGRTSAPHQHLRMSVFRAIETRRPLIRAANTGFSVIVEPTGAIRARSQLFEECVLTGSVPIQALPMTFYTRFGDFFLKALLLISLAHVLYDIWVRRRAS